MRYTTVNANWQYKASEGVIVDVNEHHILKNLLINSIQEGDDGITAWCVLDGERISYNASEKLKRQILEEEYNNWEELTEEEIERQDANFLLIWDSFED